MNASHQIAVRHFGKRTVSALAKKGVTVTGLQALPNGGDFLNTSTSYVVNDNGTGRVLTFSELLGMK